MKRRKRASSASTLSNIMVALPASADNTSHSFSRPLLPPHIAATLDPPDQLTAEALDAHNAWLATSQKHPMLPPASATPTVDPGSSEPNNQSSRRQKKRKMMPAESQADPVQRAASAPGDSATTEPATGQENKVTYSAGEPTEQDKRTMRSMRENKSTPVTSLLRRYDTLIILFPTKPNAPPIIITADAQTPEPVDAVTRKLDRPLELLNVVPDELNMMRKNRAGKRGESDRELLIMEALRGGWIEITGKDARDGSEEVRARMKRAGEEGSVAFDFYAHEDKGQDAEMEEIERAMKRTGVSGNGVQDTAGCAEDELDHEMSHPEEEKPHDDSDPDWVG